MAKRIVMDIESALDIYFRCPEIGTAEIKQIFNCGDSCAWRLKKLAAKVMDEKGKQTLFPHNVNTKCAFEAWQIDVSDLERRVSKIRKLEGVRT